MKIFRRCMLVCLITLSQTSLLTLADSLDKSDSDKKDNVEQEISNNEFLKDNLKESNDILDTEEFDKESLGEINQSNSDIMEKKESDTEELIVKESDVNEEVNEPEVEKTEVKQQYSARITETVEENKGDGTQENPYLVSNAKELKKRFEVGTSAEQTIYIKLTEDIIYTNKDFMTAHSSIVLDGNNCSILYDGTSYATPHFSVNRPGANITLKNIHYGNEDYPNSTNRGIMLIDANGVNLNIENITYNIFNGSQPFYARKINSTLNFYGSNTFELNNGNFSEEFSQGIDNINFMTGSMTKLETNNIEGYPFFSIYSNLNLNIQDSATLQIITNKNNFINVGRKNSLNIGKDSNLSINFTNSNSSMGANSNFIVDNNGSLNISYSGSGKGIDMKNTKIDVNDPKEIRLNSKNTDEVINLGTVELANIDNQTYQLLSNSNNQWSQIPFEGNSIILKNNKIKSYVYKPRMTLSDISMATDTSSDTSRIKALITGIPNHMVLPPKYFADYLISEESYSQDGVINQLKVSEEFEDSQDNHQSNSKVVSGDLSEVVAFNNLVGDKTYYIYARVRAFGEVDETTAWYEGIQYLPAYIEVSLPKKINFSGTNIIKTLNDELLFKNHGNVPTEVKFDLVERNGNVKLVDEVNKKNKNELQLDFVNDEFKWNFADHSSNKSLKLEPFMKSGSQKNMSLTGTYSGPNYPIEKVSYKVNVTTEQVKGGEG